MDGMKAPLFFVEKLVGVPGMIGAIMVPSFEMRNQGLNNG
jgi:hypothetical protein